MLSRLMYISRSRLGEADVAAELASIANVSASRNLVLSVTGALLHTGRHFSQILEGDAGDIENLMASIRADRRHDTITIIEQTHPRVRQFSNWSTVYTGRSIYVRRLVEACLALPEEPAQIAKLLQLFREFARV